MYSHDFLDFTESVTSADLIIFGAGMGGRGVGEYIRRMNAGLGKNIRIRYFFDNDPDKWEKDFFGRKICRPEATKIREKDKIVIASLWYREITEQLIGMGVHSGRIIRGVC